MEILISIILGAWVSIAGIAGYFKVTKEYHDNER